MKSTSSGTSRKSREDEFPLGGSEMGALVRALDWSKTSLGTDIRLACASQSRGQSYATWAQIVLFWGPELVALYNDAYAPTIGDKHPQALGRPARENWAELWDDLEPLLRRVLETGETVFAKDRPFYIERHGYPENVYFDISYSPVWDEAGKVGGVLCIVSETTERVVAQERQRLLLRETNHRCAIGCRSSDCYPGILGAVGVLLVLALFRLIERSLPSEFYAHHMLRFARDRVMGEAEVQKMIRAQALQSPICRRG